MTRQAISLCIALVSVPVVLLGWSIAAHNVRVRRVRKLARTLPAGTRERILARITEAARGSSVCTLLVPVNSVSDEPQNERMSPQDITASRFGGPPYGEAGEQWPTRDDGDTKPADFLIQVRLDDPLPSPWLGRLVVVFWRFDSNQTAFVYAAPSPARHVPRPGGPDAGSGCELMPLPIPRTNLNPTGSATIQSPPGEDRTFQPDREAPSEDGNWQLPYDPDVLLEVVPGLRDELRTLTRRPADLLAQLIAPDHYGYGVDLSDIVQTGGDPEWLQSDPGPMTCAECGQPMRFLFQFGDLSGQNRLGDAGVCYVFGCDAHPDRAQSVVQMC